jgi:arylsulfatase A-like enzyme
MHFVRCIDYVLSEASLALLQQESTLLLFAADNGPSLGWENLGGNNGALRCGKGTTFEGGQRSAGFAVWPGKSLESAIIFDHFLIIFVDQL